MRRRTNSLNPCRFSGATGKLCAYALSIALSGAACSANLEGNALSSVGSDSAGSSQGLGAGGGDGQAPTGSLLAGDGNLAIRRLLNRELVNVYRDLLGQDAANAVDLGTLEADGTLSSYDNDVTMQSMSSTRLQGYMNAASAATAVALNGDHLKGTLGCSPVTDDCIGVFLPKFGRRLFRRAMTGDELAQYKALYTSESDKTQGATLMLRALLSSPQLLYQPEVGSANGAPLGYVRLTSLEVASKLSFLLLGTTPSEALLTSGEADKLKTADQVAAAANVMLQQPAGQAYLRNFAVNWLGIATVATNTVTSLPNDTTQLHADMAEETLRLFDDFVLPGTQFSGFYAAPYTYISAHNAAVYGASPPGDGKWVKLDLTGKPRAGFLTQPSVLNATGIADFPAISRGKYVLERILCRNAGSPPANVSSLSLPASAIGGTEREQLAAHTVGTSCKTCHESIDPIGFGFERYDAAGNYQTADDKGRPYTGRGSIAGQFDFTDASQLGQLLATDETAQRCVAQNLAHYLLGRQPVTGDDAVVTRLATTLKGKDLPAAVIDFVSSDAFLTRKVN